MNQVLDPGSVHRTLDRPRSAPDLADCVCAVSSPAAMAPVADTRRGSPPATLRCHSRPGRATSPGVLSAVPPSVRSSAASASDGLLAPPGGVTTLTVASRGSGQIVATDSTAALAAC